MKRFLLATLVFLAACSEPSTDSAPAAGAGAAANATPVADAAHNSRNSLDWPGTYAGTVPCADCKGIRTTIRLQADGNFTRELLYLGKSNVPVRDAGMFTWNDAGSIVTLASENGEPQQYQVGENRLFHLDRSGNRIAGELADRYVLEKAPRDARLEDKRWELTEVMGQPVAVSPEGSQAFVRFDGAQGTVNGNNSCNNFFGTYVLAKGGRVRFGDDLAATMMACPDMTVEVAFMDALRRIDNYAIDGENLSLNRARMAPLLRFRAAPGP